MNIDLKRATRNIREWLDSSRAHIAARDSDMQVRHINGLLYAAKAASVAQLLIENLDQSDTVTYEMLGKLEDEALDLVQKFESIYKLYIPTAPAQQAIESLANNGEKPKPTVKHVVAKVSVPQAKHGKRETLSDQQVGIVKAYFARFDKPGPEQYRFAKAKWGISYNTAYNIANGYSRKDVPVGEYTNGEDRMGM